MVEKGDGQRGTADPDRGPPHAQHRLSAAELARDARGGAIFRNGARYLPEWIEFHSRRVERFYIYENNSTDDWEAAIAPFSDIVELHRWPELPVSTLHMRTA